MMQKAPEIWLKSWHMGTHLRVLSESFPMNTNTTGFSWFSKILRPTALDEGSLNNGRVEMGCCSLLPLWFGPYVGLSLINIHWVFANTRGVDIKSVCRWSHYPNSIKLPQTRTTAVYGAYDYSSTGTAVSPGILACTVQNVSKVSP